MLKPNETCLRFLFKFYRASSFIFLDEYNFRKNVATDKK